jgi:hypothetical protein
MYLSAHGNIERSVNGIKGKSAPTFNPAGPYLDFYQMSFVMYWKSKEMALLILMEFLSSAVQLQR